MSAVRDYLTTTRERGNGLRRERGSGLRRAGLRGARRPRKRTDRVCAEGDARAALHLHPRARAEGVGRMTTRATVYEYRPVGWDIFDPKTDLSPGARVVKTQPVGCPKNGTMDHCFVADAESGAFVGLVHQKSLVRTAERKEVAQ